jgi:HAD superfamily hydrolase (TIGR01509 family)
VVHPYSLAFQHQLQPSPVKPATFRRQFAKPHPRSRIVATTTAIACRAAIDANDQTRPPLADPPRLTRRAETFARQPARFPFLDWFDGIVVSGREKLIKPGPRIFRLLLDRYGIDASRAVFIDDVPANTAAAAALGMRGIHFTRAGELRGELVRMSLL